MRYEEYKPIDAKWESAIPSHWDYVPLRHIFIERKEINVTSSCTDILSLTNTHGVIPYSQKGNMGNKQKDDLSSYHIAHVGDLVVNSMNVIIGSSGVSKYHGCVSPVYYTLTIRNDDNVDYYGYLFKIPPFFQSLKPLGNGILEIRLRIPMNKLNTVMIPVPPREEQDQIVRYLDWKVSCINKLIHGYQRQIKLLEERRHSVVENYILKDCNEYRTMALHYAVEFIVDCPHETPVYDPDGCYYVIRTADEGYGELRTDDAMYKLQEEEYKKRTRRARLNKGDIVYGREGERWGLACLVPESNKYCLGQRMIQIRCNTKFLLPEYAVWLLNTNYVYQQGYVEMLGSTSPHVNVATIGSYRIKVPSLDKQKEVAAYINAQMDNINDAVRHIEKEIDLLKEYRTRLISDVVTGQMDVRGVVVPEYTPETDEEDEEIDEPLSDVREESEV